jgi:hypothetical protein
MSAHHRRARTEQRVWIVFGGRADHAWQRLLRPGFRHCFAAVEDAAGWLVLDPLTGRLLLGRLELPEGFDLPRFYRRAGLRPVGPFALSEPTRGAGLGLAPYSCVALCRAVLGPHAPFALTPHGLYRRLLARAENRKKCLTSTGASD